MVSLAAALYWRLWDNGLRVPLAYSGDSLFYQSLAKTVATRKWYLENPSLGAPGGQALYDFPLGSDNLHLLSLRILSVLTKDPIILVNIFYYLSFPLVFAAAYYSLRRLRISRPVAATFGLVYALAPFHFVRNETQLFLSAYYSVPLACLLLFDILGDRNQAEDRLKSGRAPAVRRWLRPPDSWPPRWLWIPIILGSAGAYFALFFLILAASLGIFLAGYHRELKRLILPAFLVGVTTAVLFVNNLPTFVYQWTFGRNEVVAQRVFGEADSLALQWGYLLLPVRDHRLAPLAELSRKVDESISPLQGYGLALGSIAAVGLLISLAAMIAEGKPETFASGLRKRAGVLNVSAILLGSVGGGSLILGLAGFKQLHEYGRLVLFIAFLSLVSMATVIEPVREALQNRFPKKARIVGLGILTAVTAVAMFDQTTGTNVNRRRYEASWREDRSFARAIENRTGSGAMVLQLPLLGFPEDAVSFPSRETPSNFVVNGRAIFNGFELFRPFLYANRLRWSYGRMQARPGDVAEALRGKPMDLFLTEAAAAGFQGLYLDRNGFPDGARQMRQELDSRVGPPTLLSRSGRMLFYDLGDYARAWRESSPARKVRAVKARVTRPVSLVWGRGFSTPYGSGLFFPQLDGFSYHRNARKTAVLEVRNPGPGPRRVSIHFTATPLTPGPSNFRVTGGNINHWGEISDAGTPVTLTATFKPGATRLHFSTDKSEQNVFPPLGKASLQIADAWIEG